MMTNSIIDAVQGLHAIFLKHFGGDNPSSITLKVFNAQYRCPDKNCPSNIVGHHSYGKNKCSVSYDIWKYHCWICNNYGSVGTLTKGFHRSELEKIAKWRTLLFEHFKTFIGQKHTALSLGDSKLEPLLSRAFVEEGEIDTSEFYRKPILKYAFSRGLTWEHIAYYNLSYSKKGKYNKALIIPSFDVYNQMNFFVARKIGDVIPPYVNADVKKTDIIFNERLIQWDKPLTLVEGPIDYLKLHGQNRALLLGTFLSNKSILFDRLKYYKPLVNILLDTDAFDRANKIADQLTGFGLTVSIVMNHLEDAGVGDVGELTVPQVAELMSKVSDSPQMNHNELMESRINKLKL